MNEDEYTKINPNIFGIVRGVFDSKYNEYLMYSDQKQWSKFPDFVYSWLGMIN